MIVLSFSAIEVVKGLVTAALLVEKFSSGNFIST
jgi:hypothetical protein